MAILGIGLDIVDLGDFTNQLSEPGRGMRRLFSVRELRQAGVRARHKGDDEAVHLASRWAAKEAVLKAWSAALGDGPAPYTVDSFPWVEIEILSDQRARPMVVMSPTSEQALYDSVVGGESLAEGDLQWHLSMTHDGMVAAAYVILESRLESRG